MAGHRGGRRRGGDDHEEHADERWLLTYSDMITLLMALFVVLWSMGSTDAAKYDALSASLKDAFSGQILPGGEAILLPGSTSQSAPAAPEPPLPAIKPTSEGKGTGTDDGTRSDAPAREEEDLQKLKREIDAYAQSHGLKDEVQTEVMRRGLVVRVLTDKILFESGSAAIKPQSGQLLDALGRLLKTQVRNPIHVEGNTDSVPVSGGGFQTNWELSTTRATSVLRALIARGVWPGRLAAVGYADRQPIATNETEGGRRRNRRVELVVMRKSAAPATEAGSNTQGGTVR